MKFLVTTCAAIGAFALSVSAASAQDPNYCHQQAVAAADIVAKPATGGLVGGALGGLAGVVAGDIIGQGKGARIAGGIIGGTVGAAAGVSTQKKKQEEAYNKAWAQCMGQPTPVYYPVPPAGSQQWVYDCSLKYKSFDANPSSPAFGTYQPYANPNGTLPPRRPCQLP